MIPVFVIAGVFAVVAALNKEHPRARWARTSLIVFALSSISTGILAYLVASGRLGLFLPGQPRRWVTHKASLPGVQMTRCSDDACGTLRAKLPK